MHSKAAALVGALLLIASAVSANNFTVTNTADFGAGSLRQAIPSLMDPVFNANDAGDGDAGTNNLQNLAINLQ